tara:strand:- start:1429 stop:1941 length:513 start_codon:yes stop_codon:yes gene_type:complete
MTNYKDLSDKQDERLLRTLLSNDATASQAERIFKRTFSDLIKWSMEDIEEQLIHAFNFKPLEIEHLLNRFSHQLPTQENLESTYKVFPNFSGNLEKANQYGNNCADAKNLLSKVKRALSNTSLVSNDFESTNEWNMFIKQRLKWNELIIDFAKYIDEQKENAFELVKSKA